MAHASGVSDGSMSPAGISMQILSMGGRYCFCSKRSGFGWEGELRMATMPTPSMSEPAGRVSLSALSQVRRLLLGSV